jgi:hypothetical protein
VGRKKLGKERRKLLKLHKLNVRKLKTQKVVSEKKSFSGVAIINCATLCYCCGLLNCRRVEIKESLQEKNPYIYLNPLHSLPTHCSDDRAKYKINESECIL